ncbi:MAG TPA: anti-sigma factor [Candidatus Koribacter sp.]|jgi:anti-sigma factor RsiW
MNCEQARALIELYADDELDLAQSLELERHVETCVACAAMLADVHKLSRAVKSSGVYGEMPSALHGRVRNAALADVGIQQRAVVVPAPRRPAPVAWWRPLGIAVAAMLILGVFAVRWLPTAHRATDENTLLAQEVLDSHVRSMMADHLYDVPSTDQHTVKPWFDGKLDFAPPVVDLTSEGFELAGGRLDYIAGRPVAAVVYRRRKHVINLSMWPEHGTEAVNAIMRNGYNMLYWKSGSLEFWAVSDLNAQEMREFVALIQARTNSR